MLESRSAYGWYGAAGGYTGENKPPNAGTIPVNMPYREYKTRYAECKNCGDYDKQRKTITVLIPASYTERPNFGNRYQMGEYYFEIVPDCKSMSPVVTQIAKNYENALKRIKAWCKRQNIEFVGDAKGYERQREW